MICSLSSQKNLLSSPLRIRIGVKTLTFFAIIIERYAAVMGIKRITSEVSLTARPFFEKRGFVVEKEQKCRANKLFLTNFVMAKELNNK